MAPTQSSSGQSVQAAQPVLEASGNLQIPKAAVLTAALRRFFHILGNGESNTCSWRSGLDVWTLDNCGHH